MRSWLSGSRTGRASASGVSGILSYGATMALGLVSVPLTVGYLGVERYGIWLTINSVLQWIYVATLALSGNALINRLSYAWGSDDREAQQGLVSTSFFGILLVAIGVAVLGLAGVWFGDVNQFFNASVSVSARELRWALTAAIVCAALGLPGSILDAVYQGLQRGYIANAWNLGGALLGLAALIAVTRREGDITALVVATFGVRLAVAVVNGVYLFGFLLPQLRPRIRSVRLALMRDLARLGSTYLVAQLAGMVSTQSQPIMISRILEPSAVGIYSLTTRVITLPMLLVQAALTPLLASYGEAHARGDHPWIRLTLRRSMQLTVIAAVPAILAAAAVCGPVIAAWASPALRPSRLLVGVTAAYALVGALITPIAVLLYGLQQARRQALIGCVTALLMVVAGMKAISAWGLTGLVGAMLVSMCVNGLLQLFYVQRTFRTLSPP